MTSRTASRLAWGLWATSLTMLLVGAALDLSNGIPSSEIAFVVLLPLFVLAFSTVGAFVASRHPGNAIGWIFLAEALLWSLATLATGVAEYGAVHGLATTPVVRVADWVGTWIFLPGIYLPVTLLFLLFPDGRLPSPRWRLAMWVSIAGLAGITAASALAPGPLEDAVVLRTNPFALGSAAFWDPVRLITWPLGILGMFASVAALIVRFRRSESDERQQIKTLMSTGILVVILLFASSFGFGLAGDNDVAVSIVEASILLALMLVPIAAGVAILKYRLYDIDLVIRKAVVFGALIVFVTVVYIVVVVGIGLAIGAAGASPALSLGATAIVAVLFQPARERAQRLADRLVYGRRATPYEVLAVFGEKVSETFAADDVLDRMATVLAQGTGAEAATVWLRVGSEIRPVATSPAGSPSPSALPEDAVEVTHQGEALGALSVRMPASDPMNPGKRKLIDDLASQAGLVLRNVRLIEELRESRRRIVAAQDEERRKIERNIHDGAQQQLVALTVKARLADAVVERDPSKARELLGQIQTETNEALETLRDLARGIYPPLLADRGLREALDAQARRSAMSVSVDADGVGRYPQDVEAAVYFCVLEALNNVAKYAEASNATVRLSNGVGELSFEVVDDGTGFDPAVTGYGTGLQGMADRLASLGGELDVRSAPGGGTTVAGRVPAEVQA